MTGSMPKWVRADLAAAIAVRDEVAPAVEDAQELAGVLYQRWYAALAADEVRPEGRPEFDLTEQLRSAHADTAVFEDGWSVRRVSNLGRAEVERDGEERVVEPVDLLVPGRIGTPPKPGDEVRVCRRRDRVEDFYWYTWSAPPADLVHPAVRVYWNVAAEGAPALVRALTTHLATTAVAWSFKVPQQTWGLERADSAVLYVDRDGYPQLKDGLVAMQQQLAGWLRPTTPRLARRLRPGVAIAEDPGNGQSFGEHRCELVASALVGQPADATTDAQIAVIANTMRDAGLDPHRPHLTPEAA